MESRTFELEFAKFIERFHDQIRDAFVEDALEKREMFSQYQLGRQMLDEIAEGVVSEFTKNVDKRTPIQDVADKYIALGMRCCEEALSLSEIVHAFVLLKRHVWLFFQESNFMGQPFDVRSIIALNNRTALFFDRAILYILTGYEKARVDDTSELERLYKEFLNKVRRDLRMT